MEMSKAAQERAAAQRARSSLPDRETYTAKQIAMRLGTDGKTLRKFFRSKYSSVEPVGQGSRYEFAAEDYPTIQAEFKAWRKKAESHPASKKKFTPQPKKAPVEIPSRLRVIVEDLEM